eukprot:CAMPEP_0173152698 /NCGR_PEP_ID=MMETSP1105-20130129/12397_1 /TAXON_ID=2985 /ORGANISM="Ochromonas sp., Strain BG-1" /LENGTH=65 /DNA_ID=CAMNT_0014068447 /DNA_START=193 /DNA_END=390 /DNA_ORIENTATION=+
MDKIKGLKPNTIIICKETIDKNEFAPGQFVWVIRSSSENKVIEEALALASPASLYADSCITFFSC